MLQAIFIAELVFVGVPVLFGTVVWIANHPYVEKRMAERNDRMRWRV